MLSQIDFQNVVEHAPLFAIDLVIMNDKQQILLGKRKNAPARGYWFVPGGRVFKNENLDSAFKRICKTELGKELERSDSQLLGVYDHFYDESAFSESISTHYINAAHLISLRHPSQFDLQAQHSEICWLSFLELENQPQVHLYSRVFLRDLIKVLSARKQQQ